MPPSWTDVTDPNVAFDTKGRVYQTTLPFNAFWGGSTIRIAVSRDRGQTFSKAVTSPPQPDRPLEHLHLSLGRRRGHAVHRIRSPGTRHKPCSQQLATHIRRAQFVFLEHSGHFPYLQERAAFWEAVRTFLPPLGIPPGTGHMPLGSLKEVSSTIRVIIIPRSPAT